MAQRFGGRFSPGGPKDTPPAPPGPEARPSGGWRATVLFLSSFAFLFPAFGDAPDAMLLGLVAGGLLILAAWLSREGLRARAAWEARATARRPAFPRLLAAAAATAAALLVGGVIAHGLTLTPVLYALAGAALHLGAFGTDPMRDKGMAGIDPYQTDRVARAVDAGERHLAAMKDAIRRADDRTLEARVDRFAAAARTLFAQVEARPGDLTAARKYLSVYLEGARDATAAFTDLWVRTRDAKARTEWEALLGDLETTFADRTRSFLEGGRGDLEIEIAVLRDRLKFETR
jgi:5-bromo-4-chloroindolyl phosphate hydrolysis protein